MNGQHTVAATPEETREIINQTEHLQADINRVEGFVSKLDERLQDYVYQNIPEEACEKKEAAPGIPYADRIFAMRHQAEMIGDRLSGILKRLAL